MSNSTKKKTKQAAASSKAPSKKDIPKAVKIAFTSTAKAAIFSLPTDQCPTRPYDGAVRLNDESLQSFLQTAGGTYLMLIDSDCSGQGSRQKVVNAYNVFSNNPGRNQRLVCQGFLHQYGTSQVLHVVHVVT